MGLIRSIFIIAIIISPFATIAQNGIGLIVGINGTKLSGEKPSGVKFGSDLGYQFGLRANLQLKDEFWLSIQPSYIEANTSIIEKTSSSSGYFYFDNISYRNFNFKNQMLSLPVLAQVRMNKRMMAYGGLGGTYVFDSKISGEGLEADLEDFISNIQASMIFGFGYSIPVGTNQIMIDLLYKQELTRLTKEVVDDKDIDRLRLSGLVVNLSFLFNSGKK